MTVSPQHGAFLTVDDVTYLADLLDHLCRTTQPSAKLSHLASQLRRTCESLTPTQGKRLRDVLSQPGPDHHATYDLVDVAEAARLLGCSASNVRDLIRRGKLTAHRSGDRWVLPARSVIERAERRAARRTG